MRKNLRGRKATAIALASVMAMSLAACGRQDGSNQVGQTEQKEYVYVPEYLELDDNTNSSYSNMTVQGDKLYYTNYQWDEASGESKVVLGAYSLTDGSREDLPITINADGGGIYSMQADAEGNIYTAEFEWNATEGASQSKKEILKRRKHRIRSWSATGFRKSLPLTDNRPSAPCWTARLTKKP